MNTTTIPTLAKLLRALSVFYILLGVYVLAVPLASDIGITLGGGHFVGFSWQSWIREPLIFLLIALCLFLCYRDSQRSHRSLMATALLWSFTFTMSAFATIVVVGMLRGAILHWHL